MRRTISEIENQITKIEYILNNIDWQSQSHKTRRHQFYKFVAKFGLYSPGQITWRNRRNQPLVYPQVIRPPWATAKGAYVELDRVPSVVWGCVETGLPEYC